LLITGRLFPSRLALYVYEYLLHVGAQKAAQTFLSEVCCVSILVYVYAMSLPVKLLHSKREEPYPDRGLMAEPNANIYITDCSCNCVDVVAKPNA
jgi:hypothetical protein